MTSRRAATLALLPALALLAAGCSADGGSAEGVQVAVTAYPLQFIADQVVGDAATVTNVAPAGTEPHDLELSPSGVATIVHADVVLMLSGFQAAVDNTIDEVDATTVVIDAADHADLLTAEPENESEHEEHDHGGIDPHFWLDPIRVADVADALADTLADVDPDHADAYQANSTALREQLQILDGEFAEDLAECSDRTFVTSHEAFGYLADAFDLTQVGISGLDPEAEPSPARVAEVLKQARAEGITTIFTQPGGLSGGADTVAAELGLDLATLDPIELEPADSDYLGAMRANLTALREGLRCR